MDWTAYIKILLVWLPQAIAQVFLWLFWMQRKEYRFDRFNILFKTPSGLKRLAVKMIFFKLIAIILFAWSPLPFLLLLALDIYWTVRLLRKKLPRPVFTNRVKNMIKVMIGGVLILVFISFLNVYNFALSLFLLELYLMFGVYLGVLSTNPISEAAKKHDTKKAKKILEKVKPRIVGITGSYGKSTTKEFLSHLISKHFKVEKTIKNQNTEFGVARKVVSDFGEDTDIFVAEMGAYTKGEIAAITQFATPSIAILTGLEPQHLELFGSFEAIKKAKFELIRALPTGGIAVFNSSNSDVEKLAKKAEKLKTKLTVWRYKSVKKFSTLKNTRIVESKIDKRSAEGISFSLKMKGKKHSFFIPIVGDHFVENVTGSIVVARLLGVPWSELKKQTRTLSTPEGTFSIKTLASGAIVVDDSYNATPKGFNVALDYLDSLDSNYQKVLITSGIIELGVESHIVHKRLGERMKDLSRIILTNSDYRADLELGLKNNKEKLLLVSDGNEAVNAFERLNTPQTVFVLEGRMPVDLIKKIDQLSLKPTL